MTDPHDQRWKPDPERDVVLDARLLRTLSHPMRIKIVGLLRLHGPATATTLAQRLGVNTGATSYHLRELAKAGLVTEDADRGNARDRWWKVAHRSTYLERLDFVDSDPEIALGYLRGVAQINAEAMFRAVDELPTLPAEWREAGTISDYSFHLTPDQLHDLLGEVEAVLARYRTEDDDPHPPGARSVAVQIQAFPREGL